MFFRQFLEPVSSTWTYLLADRATGDAVIIDPVLETVDRDIQNILDLGLTLRWTLETHVHADHITAAAALKDRLGCQTGVSGHAGLDCVDRALVHGDRLTFGGHALTVVETPGHTLCSLSYLTDGPHRMAFTGDALLIRGCGRTDFQNGSASKLYQAIHREIFSLPDDTTVYPGHDYNGRTASTVGEERRLNPRLTKSEADFVALMAGLNLPRPKLIDVAVPANLQCGRV
jgi:glyoxylase-like metal-dependent hydrolase (beta-lactamase superfamily II)